MKGVSRARTFSERYDAMISRRGVRALYGMSGFYNVGDWVADTDHLQNACAALVRRHIDAIEYALDESAPVTPRVVLDIGCGFGDGTRMMAERWPGALVVGINISPVQLDHAHRHHAGVAWAAMDAVRLAVADGAVDLILSVEAAFHFRSRAAFLAAAWRALRPGGVLVLSDVLFDEPDRVGAWWISENEIAGDLNGYAALCRAAGFEMVRLEDITTTTWHGFCRHLRGKPHWRAVANWIEPAVGSYLLAALRKPRD